MKRTTIFSQLVINVITPVIVALLALALLIFFYFKNNSEKTNRNKNKIISTDIKRIMSFQDLTLSNIEAGLNTRMQELSSKLTNNYFYFTESIDTADLTKIHKELGMVSGVEDIYIINSDGIVVNSTLKADVGLNMFGFGEAYKSFLQDIMKNKSEKIERFSIESSTKRVKKYSYRSTRDGKYIIELGFYSEQANRVMQHSKDEVNDIIHQHDGIISIDLFFGDEMPVSFNNPDRQIMKTHMPVYLQAMEKKTSLEMDDDVGGENLHYEYIYMPRENSDLYSHGIIRIISDRSKDAAELTRNLLIFFILFAATVIILFLIILNKSKTITKPIIQLASSVVNISQGDLRERTEVTGNNEITTLSEQFNEMLERLEKSYNELEQKVIERTAEIMHQKEKLDEQNQQITDSIRYAKRIQTAILPSDEVLDNIIKEHFVLFKPRDIVSGDFYWAGEKNGKSIIAAADCTGHGVPGAFMSMIGNTLLNQIVLERGVTDPSKILWDLRKEIITLLAQKGSKQVTKSKDGMDIAVCVIDYKNKKLQFAGANNPLFLIRNGELEVIKGSRQPVGSHMLEEEPFLLEEMDLFEGDRLYIFSDGYQDQYGGEDGRKFMVGQFKRLLVEISKKPMYAQKDLLNNTIEQWMSATRQIDDILVIGIKI